jgi:hypothetical protein
LEFNDTGFLQVDFDCVDCLEPANKVGVSEKDMVRKMGIFQKDQQLRWITNLNP